MTVDEFDDLLFKKFSGWTLKEIVTRLDKSRKIWKILKFKKSIFEKEVGFDLAFIKEFPIESITKSIKLSLEP